MYSVTEAAKKLGTTRTTIYNKLRQPEFESLVITEKGQAMLTEELINLIGESLKPKTTPQAGSDQVFSQVLQTLTEQLTVKDQQIKALQEQIAAMQSHADDLVRLNDNQQQLMGRNMLQLESSEDKKKKWYKPWER